MRRKHNAQSFPYRQRDRGMVTSNPIESEFLGLDRAHMHPRDMHAFGVRGIGKIH